MSNVQLIKESYVIGVLVDGIEILTKSNWTEMVFKYFNEILLKRRSEIKRIKA